MNYLKDRKGEIDLFTRLKIRSYTIFVMMLLIPLFLPFAKTADAYGLINHEKVVEVGKNHFVVLKTDGSVWSWGDNTYGQMGANSSVPTAVSAPTSVKDEYGNRLSKITAIAAGGDHTVALDKDGAVWTWGRNADGQLAQPSISPYRNENPKKVEGPLQNIKIKAIAAGDYHTLAVTEDGEVWAWGSNTYGQLGVGTGITGTEDSSIPVKVSNVSGVVAVAAGVDHSIALKQDGTVWSWGRNTKGQLGNGETTSINITPRVVPGLTNIMEIAAGDYHTLALKQDQSTIWAWGSNFYGQLGDGGREDKLKPIQVQGIRGVTTIAAGDNHTLAIKEDGTVWTWGRNTSGTATNRTTPIQLKGVTNATAIGGGGEIDSFTLVARQDGTIWFWNKASSDATTKEPIVKQVDGIDSVMQGAQFPFVQGSQVLFRYYSDNDVASVKVNGSFNDWIDLPLVEVTNNVWELQVPLKSGEYNYGFYVNGKWTVDPLNRNKTMNDFGKPLSVVTVSPYATEGPIINGRNVTFMYSSYDYNQMLELNAKTDYVAVVGNFSNWEEVFLERQANNIWTLTQTLEPGDYYYSFVVRDLIVSPDTEERNDPLNLNLVSDSDISRNKFYISELLPTTVPVKGISLNKGPLMDLIVGEQESVRETVSPSNASNKNVNWSSSNPAIVNVDATGKLTALSKGTAVIICSTVDGGKTVTLTVTVNEKDNAVSYPRVGYKEYGSPRGVISSKIWKVNFNQALDKSSLTSDNIYILNESGIKVPLAYLLQSDEKTLEIRLASGYRYNSGATYYLFIEKGVKTKTGSTLKEPIQMKFTIQL